MRTYHKQKFSFSSISFRLPLYLTLFCAALSIANGIIGYRVFMSLFERQYRDVTEQFAETAISYMDTDAVESYAAGAPADDAWKKTDAMLDVLTVTAQLAYIYVTVPDPAYESRVYIFDTVHPDVVNGKKYTLGQVNSLKGKRYDADYIRSLRQVMDEGKNDTRFVYNKTGGHVTTSVPVKNSAGKVVAIMSVVKPMSEVREFKNRYRTATFVTSMACTAGFVIMFILSLISRIIKPMTLITQETNHFAEHGGKISDSLAKIRGKSELAVLARAVEKMSVDMNKYIEDLTQATVEKERLSAELNVAAQIQANMLPRLFPPYQDHPELELFASMDPAKEVGGDFYDFFMVDNDHFAVVVGDVSGKGVPAALFMVIAKTLLKNAAMQGYGPDEVFMRVNNQLCEGNEAGLFVTCWIGLLTLSTGELRFANAGHTPPVICRGETVEFLKSKPNLMLAEIEGIPYSEYTTVLNRGDRLFVYTDGVTEATNASDRLYGEERLLNACKRLRNVSSKELLKSIRDDIDAFVAGAPQFDDITMLELSLKA